MSTPFGRLNGDAVDQVQKYLRFFRHKKDGLTRTVMRELDIMKNDRLENDDGGVYSKEEMEEFAFNVIGCVRGYMNGELGTIINMGGLAVSQLLETAQDKGCDIELDISAVENVALLEAVDKMSLDAIPKARVRGLTSLKDEARAAKDANEALEELNKKLTEEISELTRKLAIQRRANKDSSRLAEGKEASEEALEEALREAKEENDKRVRDTNQFLTMKKLMQSQAANIRDLKRRLEQYEPDDVADSKDED